jgi:energy-coupling factor transporter ATP-binding protein EcfA2
LLDELAPKATRVFCSHRRDEFVAHVDRVVALADGKVVFDDSTAAYLTANAPRSRDAGRAHLALVPDPPRMREGA